MIDWTTVENAVHAWVVSGSQFPSERVIWAAQSGPRPDGQIVVLRFADLVEVGRDWRLVVDAPSPSSGAEVLHQLQGHRVATLSLQVFGGWPLGANSNLAVLARVLAATKLPSVLSALRAANVGILASGRPLAIDGSRGSILEPRAVAEVQLCLVAELAEAGTYVERAELTTEVGDTTSVIQIPPSA